MVLYRKGLSVNELKETAKKSQEEEMRRRREERQEQEEQKALCAGHQGDSSDKLMPKSSSVSLLDKSRKDSSPVKACQNSPSVMSDVNLNFLAAI